MSKSSRGKGEGGGGGERKIVDSVANASLFSPPVEKFVIQGKKKNKKKKN